LSYHIKILNWFLGCCCNDMLLILKSSWWSFYSPYTWYFLGFLLEWHIFQYTPLPIIILYVAFDKLLSCLGLSKHVRHIFLNECAKFLLFPLKTKPFRTFKLPKMITFSSNIYSNPMCKSNFKIYSFCKIYSFFQMQQALTKLLLFKVKVP